MELYKKVEIKSEKDLPKKNGYYFVNIGDKYDISEDVFRWENGDDKLKKDWIKNVDWYLQPVDEKEQQEQKLQTAEEIVKENFHGLDSVIEDKSILKFYKGLIVTCLEGYASQFQKPNNEIG